MCILSGRYAFYIPGKPFGFISGSVLKSGVDVSGAVLNVDNLPFKTVTDSSGNFMILSLINGYTIKVLESGTGQSASAAGVIGDGETKNIILNLSAANPVVISVVPSDKATNVAPKSQIKVTFSMLIDALTINTGTFEILEIPTPLSQAPIGGHISLASGNTMAVFTPDSELKANMSYRVRLSADIKDTFGNTLIPFESVFTTAEVLGNEVLPPGALKVSMPDADGYVIVRGGAGLAAPGTPVLVINKTKNIVLTIVANEDGSFEGRVRADISDEVVVQVKDLLGNTTTLSTGLMQNPDGTAAVGSKGGTIYGPGGIKAVVPEGAFDEAVVVRVTMGTGEDIKDVHMDPEMATAGVFHLDSGGVKSKKEIKVSIPAPDWITPEHQILITKVVNVRGFDELTLACPAVLKDGQIVSTSPPFIGVVSADYSSWVVSTWHDPKKGVGYALVET